MWQKSENISGKIIKHCLRKKRTHYILILFTFMNKG